jgi:anti-sigma factor RsiW
MLKCRQLVALSSDYLDAQLGLRQRLAVRAHLAICWKCRRFVRQLRLSQAVLRQLPDAPVDDLDERARVLAAAHRDSRT